MKVITWKIIKQIVFKKKQVYKNVEENLNKGIGLYGSGRFGQYVLDYMKGKNFKDICFVNSNRDMIGKKIRDIAIKSLSDFNGGVIFITVRNTKVINELKTLIDNQKIGGAGGG